MLGLAPRAWLYVAIAFALGVGLFLLIWARQRGSEDFYRPDTSRQGVSGEVFEPLPQPDSGDAGLDETPTAVDDGEPSARIVETRPAPPPPEPAAPVPPSTPDAAAGRTAALDSPPVPVSSPPPDYPRAALRRRESGDVLLRVHVGPDGVPRSPLGYGIWADGLGLVLDRLHTELPGTPLLVAEYGIGTDDDAQRAEYLRRGLELTADAIAQGIDVRGFFHWTGVDNYEWIHGYDVQFGIIDRDRNVRPSAQVLATVARDA